MERFHYEIVAAADATDRIPEIEAAIATDRDLAQVGARWTAATSPRQSDLYALLVVCSTGLSSDTAVAARVAAASAGGFPVVPVVPSVGTYDFSHPPIAEVSAFNAVGLDEPDRLLRSLRHHAGLDLFEGGGRVFISYGRRDCTPLAESLREALIRARIGQSVDTFAFPGGSRIQGEIESRIRSADLVVLLDSQAAADSPWVAEEMDLARVAHVPVVAVTPRAEALPFNQESPHVEWRPDGDVVQATLRTIRRVLSRKETFRVRVDRTLARLARLRGWSVSTSSEGWSVAPGRGRPITVAAVASHPLAEDVFRLRRSVQPRRGLLVAGARPLRDETRNALALVGGRNVDVCALPSLASRLLARAATEALRGRRVFLSCAMPDDPDDQERARSTLAPFVVALTEVLLEFGATLVFGGHPSVTPLVHRVVVALGPRAIGRVELHQGRRWDRDLQTLPEEVRIGPLFRNVHWHGRDGDEPAASVAALRDSMIVGGLDAAVFVGGKTLGPTGGKPGIQDEFERFTRANPGSRAFRVGLAGGAAARLLPSDDTGVGPALRALADPDMVAALILAELLGA